VCRLFGNVLLVFFGLLSGRTSDANTGVWGFVFVGAVVLNIFSYHSIRK